MLVVLLVVLGCDGSGDGSGDPCADPGEAIIHCDQAWTDGGEPASAVYVDETISCVDYAEHGDQLYESEVSGCDNEVKGRDDGVCTCTKDTSACAFPCGQND